MYLHLYQKWTKTLVTRDRRSFLCDLARANFGIWTERCREEGRRGGRRNGGTRRDCTYNKLINKALLSIPHACKLQPGGRKHACGIYTARAREKCARVPAHYSRGQRRATRRQPPHARVPLFIILTDKHIWRTAAVYRGSTIPALHDHHLRARKLYFDPMLPDPCASHPPLACIVIILSSPARLSGSQRAFDLSVELAPGCASILERRPYRNPFHRSISTCAVLIHTETAQPQSRSAS